MRILTVHSITVQSEKQRVKDFFLREAGRNECFRPFYDARGKFGLVRILS